MFDFSHKTSSTILETWNGLCFCIYKFYCCHNRKFKSTQGRKKVVLFFLLIIFQVGGSTLCRRVQMTAWAGNWSWEFCFPPSAWTLHRVRSFCIWTSIQGLVRDDGNRTSWVISLVLLQTEGSSFCCISLSVAPLICSQMCWLLLVWVLPKLGYFFCAFSSCGGGIFSHCKDFCYLCNVALSCAMLKQITSSPEGKTVWEVSHEKADLIPLCW